ncbi:MAG: hypothetical protein LAT84_09685 [Balneolia bacterium]|nr:hypothetical protein [Balneolia bacterium]
METLIILFVIYSLFQWLFGDNKKKQQQKQRQQQQQQRDQRASGREEAQEAPQSWEDAMAELESIFSGESSRRQEPKPEPVPVQQTETYNRPQTKREQISENPFSDDMSSKRRSQNAGIDTNQLESAGNPIYSGAIGESDEDYEKIGGIDSGDAKDVLQFITDPEAARKAIIMKEILDRPKSQRRSARVF